MARALRSAVTRAQGESAELVRVLLNARSSAEANLALSLLRESFSDADVVALANLRELLAELPAPPIRTAAEVGLLVPVLGYDSAGATYRQAFDSDEGVFGLEFVGEGNRIDRIVLLTVAGRSELTSGDAELITPACVDMLLQYSAIVERLAEALVVLGVPLRPRFYLSVRDFVCENASASVADLGGLF